MSIPLNVTQFSPAGRLATVDVSALRPTQVDLRPEKIKAMVHRSARSLPEPFVSAQGNVHDGHHRVAAAFLRHERAVRVRVF